MFASRHCFRGTWIQLVVCDDGGQCDIGDIFIVLRCGSLVDLETGETREQNDRERFVEISKEHHPAFGLKK